MDFLSGALDPRITFTRASNATLIASDGTLQYAPHNLIPFSESFDNAAWVKVAATITANAATAPDGTTTADKLVESAATAWHYTRPASASLTPLVYAISVYAKAAERSVLQIVPDGTFFPSAFANFDLSNGTVSASSGVDSATITSVGDGWYRCIVVDTSTAAASTTPFYLTVQNSPTAARVASYLGDGTSGIFLWGAQLNIGALQPYYPTSGVAYQGPRFDHDPITLAPRGLLIEEQRINSIRNSTAQGAVAGTPGTVPTNWSVSSSSVGLTREVVGTGTVNGLPYIDIRYSGTPTSTAGLQVAFEGVNTVAAATGQAWASSAFVALVGGSATNTDCAIGTLETNGSSGLVNNLVSFTPTATLTRYSLASTLSGGGSVTHIQPRIRIGVVINLAVNITLRIGLPQLEQGAFATSVIPTTGAAATREADVAVMTGANFSSWYNASEGTVFADWTSISVNGAAGGLTYSVGLTDNASSSGSAQLAIQSRPLNNQIRSWQSTTGGGLDDFIVLSSVSFAGKAAVCYGASVNVAGSANGGALQTMPNALQTSAFNALTVGSAAGTAGVLNGHIRRIEYYSRRLTNVELQGLTATPSVPAFTWSITGLPPGLNANGPTISGTPTAPGFYVLDVTATNSLDTDAAALALTINPAAVVSAAQSGGWGKFIRQ
jgi:hypothetical protein